MGFWNWFLKKERSSEEESKIMAELTINNKKYMLTEFRISLRQDINEKNQPDGRTHGGEMFLTMDQVPDSNLIDSSINSMVRYNGEVNFYSCNNKIDTGSLFTIIFKDARCVNLYRKTRINATSNYTRLLLLPGTVFIGEEEL